MGKRLGIGPFLWGLTAAAVLLAAKSDTAVSSSQLPDTVQDLYIDILIGPPLVPAFNSISRADDIAHVYRPEQLPQLAEIRGAQHMLILRSVAEAEEQLPQIASQIDILGYNIEHGPGTPPEEQEDPVLAVQKMRELADQYGLALAIGPDHDFALSHGPLMAPYADYFVLQIQRQQTNPPVVIDFVSTLVPKLRAANQDIQISVQVRTEGDMQEIADLLQELLPTIDGVSILTSPSTVETATELLHLLRGPSENSPPIYLPIITNTP